MSKQKDKNKTVKVALPFMLKLAWKNKPSMFLVYFVQLIAETGNKLLPIILSKYIIEYLNDIVNGNLYSEVREPLILVTGLLIVSNFIFNTIQGITTGIKAAYAEWFNRYLESSISKHAMNMDFEHTENPEALDQLNKAKEGISWYSGGVEGILTHFYNIILNISILFGGTLLIFQSCPWLLVVQIIGLVFIAYFNWQKSKIEVESFQKLSGLNRRFGYYFYQVASFQYGKDIRLYNSVDMFSKRAHEENQKMYQVWKEQAVSQMKYDLVGNVVNGLRDGVSYFYLGYLALTKAISIGDFTMCVSSASAFYHAMLGIVDNLERITSRCNYIGEYIQFLEYPAALTKGTQKVEGDKHVIEFKDVSFKYPRSENYVLRHVNLTIQPEEHLSIVGLNGAGKTTFIKLLCRLYDVTEGEILLDGRNIKEYSDEEYRKVFAPVFQDFQLFAFSLKENVALTNTVDCKDKEIQHALELSGVYDDAVKLEQGIDTIIYKSYDEKGTELSGGQRQKVAISRALYKNAPVVILDEPTAALDPMAEYEIYKKFHELVGGKTAIYISHRLSSCKFCDKIAVFAEDHIREYGTHDELVGKIDGIYAKMFAAQAQYYV